MLKYKVGDLVKFEFPRGRAVQEGLVLKVDRKNPIPYLVWFGGELSPEERETLPQSYINYRDRDVVWLCEHEIRSHV